MPYDYCRTCGSDATGNSVCLHCGQPPYTGHYYCNQCATLSFPNATSCTACGFVFQKRTNEQYISESPLNASIIATIVMLFGFILPWFNNPDNGTINGVDLHKYAGSLIVKHGEIGFLALILYLLPCICLVILLAEFRHINFIGKGTLSIFKILIGVLPVFFIISFIQQNGVESIHTFSAGVYATLFCSAYFLITETIRVGLTIPSTISSDPVSIIRKFTKFVVITSAVLLVSIAIIFIIRNFLPNNLTQSIIANTINTYTDSAASIVNKKSMLSANQDAETVYLLTGRNNSERKQIMDVLRTAVLKDFKQPVLFSVKTLRSNGTYVFVSGQTVTLKGKAINYQKTRFKQTYKDGAWEDVIHAVLKKENGKWNAVQYIVGCSAICYNEWPAKYGFSKKLIGINEVSEITPSNLNKTQKTNAFENQPVMSDEKAVNFPVYINGNVVDINLKAYEQLLSRVKANPCEYGLICGECKASGFVRDTEMILTTNDLRAIKTCMRCKGNGYLCR